MRPGRLWKWLKGQEETPDPFEDPRHDVDAHAHVSRYQRGELVRDQQEREWIEVDRVVEALARQEALGVSRLQSTVVRQQRWPEMGRTEACEEISKELGIRERVVERAGVLRRRA